MLEASEEAEDQPAGSLTSNGRAGQLWRMFSRSSEVRRLSKSGHMTHRAPLSPDVSSSSGGIFTLLSSWRTVGKSLNSDVNEAPGLRPHDLP